MKIGLDARSIFMPRPRGTGRNLSDAYRLIPGLRPDWRFVLYHQRAARDCPLFNLRQDDGPVITGASAAGGQPAQAEGPQGGDSPWQHANLRTRRIEMPGDRFDCWLQVRLPLAAWRDSIDLLHFPANAAPAWCPVPFVVTIHDLIPLKIDGELAPRAQRLFLRGVGRAVRKAAHIIVVSGATRNDLHDHFGVPPEKTTVIPWAPDSGFTAEPGAESEPFVRHAVSRVRECYELTPAWLLNFSGASSRKNATGLIQASARVPAGLRERFQLVLVGCEPPSFRAQLATQAERLGIRAQCRFLGFVPHDDLPGLLRGARGLLMPSLYEGFGLPILDAFACGVPVLTSQVSSMPEIAGDAAIYCDPRNPQSIADGIVRLLDETVAANLVRKGFDRLCAFRWEQTAQAMCGVYERCLSECCRAHGAAVNPPPPQLPRYSATGGTR